MLVKGQSAFEWKKMASNVDVIGDITSTNGWVISINYM
jgi:hypothetical protein